MMRSTLLFSTVLLAVVVFGTNADEATGLPFSTGWLKANDRAEFEKLEGSDRGRFLIAAYERGTAADQSDIRNDVLPTCYSSWTSQEERAELERLHDAGEHERCKERVRELLEALPADKRTEVESYWPFCDHVWYKNHDHSHHMNHHHGRRSVGRHTRHVSFDSFATEHLAWLSDAERAEVKTLHEESKEKARARIFELFEATSGEKRTQAINQLQAACRELIVHTFGEETAKELRKMKESGTSDEDIGKKITELLDRVTDEQKKAKALEYRDTCDKIYKAKAANSRRRREGVHHHDLETKLKSEWSWLTNEQKEEVRNLKTQGKSDDFLLGKVFEYFKTAESKQAAEDGLQTSCGGAILTILGPEKAEVLKEFMANGAKPEVYEAKVKELLNQSEKEGTRRSLTPNQQNCKRVFTEASRKKRDHHEHTHSLEHYLEKHLQWLSEDQKNELRTLHNEKHDEDALHKKIMTWYDEATGETKEQAKAALQAGCRDILTSVIGPEKMEEVKKLKESGTDPNDLATKVDEFVKEVTDEKKLARGRKYETQCKKLFGVSTSRRRRDSAHDHHTLEDYLNTHLTWLTDAQKEEVRKLKSENKGRDEIHKHVMDIYDGLTGETKEKATAELQASCREMYAKYFTADQMAELKKLKESGASDADLRAKGDEFVSKIEDADKKKDAEYYSGSCRKVFGVDRRRRHEHHYNH